MVDRKGSIGATGPFEHRLPEHGRKYRASIRRKLRRKEEQSNPPPNNFPAHTGAGSIVNRAECNDGSVRQHRSLSAETSRELYQEEMPPPKSSPSTQQVIKQNEDSTKSNASFHVRISIGYMTGLNFDRINKRLKQPANNRITVGFVELASSRKYTALSQPLLTNVTGPAKTTKLLWASKRDGEEVSKSKSRRRLHFSVQLEKEDARDDDDDDSVCSHAPFVPEVVKLLVGVKCGEERIPLGIAKLVVSGRETIEQKMDLAVLPLHGHPGGSKAKRGLFAKKQKNSFTNGDLSYSLAPSATLRVKTDVRTGYPGQDGAEIWGTDDSSYTTKWTFEAGSRIANETGFSARTNPSTTSSVNFSRRTSKLRSRSKFKRFSQPVERIDSSMHTSLAFSPHARRSKIKEAPLEVVAVDSSNDLVSVLSGLSYGGCDTPWSCIPLCGAAEATGFEGFLHGSFSFDSIQVKDNERDYSNRETRMFDARTSSSLHHMGWHKSGNSLYLETTEPIEESDESMDDSADSNDESRSTEQSNDSEVYFDGVDE